MAQTLQNKYFRFKILHKNTKSVMCILCVYPSCVSFVCILCVYPICEVVTKRRFFYLGFLLKQVKTVGTLDHIFIILEQNRK